MQAHPVSRRLSILPHNQHVLNRQLRPSARPVAPPPISASTSASFSSSKQAPQSSPRDADANHEGSQYTNDGSTTYRTRPGKRALPLPPLMDPIALSARERWTEPKKPAPAMEDLTPFQQKLYQNAYAHALATPNRLDRTTVAILPTFFHLPLHPSPHPETGDPWLLPILHHAAGTPTPTAPKRPGANNTNYPTTYILLRRALLRILTTPNKRAKPSPWRFALNARLEDKLGRGGGGSDSGSSSSSSSSSNNDRDDNATDTNDTSESDDSSAPKPGSGANSGLARRLVFRADMDEVALRALRAATFRRLHWAFSKPRGGGLLARLPASASLSHAISAAEAEASSAALAKASASGKASGPAAAVPTATIGALLLLRPSSTSPAAAEVPAELRRIMENCDQLVDQMVKIRELAARKEGSGPQPGQAREPKGMWDAGGPRVQPGVLYAGLEYPVVRCKAGEEGEREVPVYGLVELLGEDKVQELVGGTAWEGVGAVGLMEKKAAIGAHQALMQLQDYLIETV